MIACPDENGDVQVTVFIVDDDEAVRDSLAALLETADLPVAAFASGREFLATYDPGQTGCLLLDLDLPDISGAEVLRRLADLGGSLPVILITGRRLRQQALEADVFAVLHKPFEVQRLLQTVRDAVRGGKPLDRPRRT